MHRYSPSKSVTAIPVPSTIHHVIDGGQPPAIALSIVEEMTHHPVMMDVVTVAKSKEIYQAHPRNTSCDKHGQEHS